MTDPLNEALVLLVIGMTTVFVVLFLVVQTGNFLIFIVNRFSKNLLENKRSGDFHNIEPAKIAAISVAVNVFTEGKGKITSITKE